MHHPRCWRLRRTPPRPLCGLRAEGECVDGEHVDVAGHHPEEARQGDQRGEEGEVEEGDEEVASGDGHRHVRQPVVGAVVGEEGGGAQHVGEHADGAQEDALSTASE